MELTMEMNLKNGLCELSMDDMLLIDGGEWSWSWSDFGASTVGNCAGGAAAGGITAACTGGACWPAVGIGAVGGAVWGAASYSVGQLWKGICG